MKTDDRILEVEALLEKVYAGTIVLSPERETELEAELHKLYKAQPFIMKNTTNIEIGNMDKETGEILAEKLNGKTYMNFNVIIAPTGGDCAISVETTYEAPREEIIGMLLFWMADEIARPPRIRPVKNPLF